MYKDQQGEPSEKCGDIHFGLNYDFSPQTLKLKIIEVMQVGLNSEVMHIVSYVRARTWQPVT